MLMFTNRYEILPPARAGLAPPRPTARAQSAPGYAASAKDVPDARGGALSAARASRLSDAQDPRWTQTNSSRLERRDLGGGFMAAGSERSFRNRFICVGREQALRARRGEVPRPGRSRSLDGAAGARLGSLGWRAAGRVGGGFLGRCRGVTQGETATEQAAIDRSGNHSTVLELNSKSVREKEARRRNASKPALEEEPEK